MIRERRHRHSNPWTLDAVRAVYAERGCVLMETAYRSTSQRVRYICPRGHEHTTKFGHFLDGHGCPKCRNERRWSGRRLELDAIRKIVASEGFSSVDVFRSESGTVRVGYTCTLGHEVETTWQHFRKGKRCKACSGDRVRGPKSPRFNPDLTPADRLFARKYEAYFAWRRSVFARDGYTCLRCSAHGTGTYLVAHHVVPYSADRSLRTDQMNGATLCRACHVIFHKTYGFQGCTPSQLADFLRDDHARAAA